MNTPVPPPPLDLHSLYEASVQNADTDLDFAARVYTRHRKTTPHTIREDFCGTAKLACTWVERGTNHHAWGVDIDQPTLDWAQDHNISALQPDEQKRIHLINADVLASQAPPTDLIFALNFSFCIFKKRAQLRTYFKSVYQGLAENGLFVFDIYGGTESIAAKADPARIIPGIECPDGTTTPDFEYIWDQAAYNPINHHTTCHIHFKIPGHPPLQKAFTYDWRLWTLPELQELLIEAGFSKAEVYLHGFTDEGESDEIFRLRKHYENAEGWVAYLVGLK